MLFYPPHIKKLPYLYVQISCKRIFLTDVTILIKLYKVAVHDLRICMKDNPGPNYFKVDDK